MTAVPLPVTKAVEQANTKAALSSCDGVANVGDAVIARICILVEFALPLVKTVDVIAVTIGPETFV